MTVCSSCTRGVHSHDTWTGDRAGQDAGCPRVAPDGHACTCPVILPTATAPTGLADWVEQVLGVQLLPWQRAYLAQWKRATG